MNQNVPINEINIIGISNMGLAKKFIQLVNTFNKVLRGN